MKTQFTVNVSKFVELSFTERTTLKCFHELGAEETAAHWLRLTSGDKADQSEGIVYEFWKDPGVTDGVYLRSPMEVSLEPIEEFTLELFFSMNRSLVAAVKWLKHYRNTSLSDAKKIVDAVSSIWRPVADNDPERGFHLPDLGK